MSSNATPFHQLLERERQKRGLSIRHIAKSARVSESEFKLWIAGAEVPTRNQILAMFGAGTPLVNYLPRENVPSVGPDRLTPPPLPKAEPGSLGAGARSMIRASVVLPFDASSPAAAAAPVFVPPVALLLPWNEILRAWRKENGLTTIDLGHLLEVDGSTVSNWEIGKFAPISLHLNKLRELVPALVDVDVPESKHVAKPGRATGSAPSSTTVAALPPALVATMDPLAAIDRILMSFDSLGQSVSLAAPERTPEGQWVFKLVTIGAGTGDAPLAIGAGPSMPAAALDMLGSLRASFASRQEQTERIVRDATARLDAQTKALGAIDGALGIGGAS